MFSACDTQSHGITAVAEAFGYSNKVLNVCRVHAFDLVEHSCVVLSVFPTFHPSLC